MRVPVIDLDSLTRNWWAVALRGLAGILFGIITFISPGISLAALVLLFGAYAFADGVLSVVSAVRRRGADRWWLLLVQGIVGIGAGVAHSALARHHRTRAALRDSGVGPGEWGTSARRRHPAEEGHQR